MKELITIQQKLKAPKGQRNSFGNYNYRSCEDILTAVKPLLAETGCSLTISDSVVNIGDRNYVCATVRLGKDKEFVITEGWACESPVKKGMDSAQITGATSSYARKYALNGMFAIDDVKDSDTDSYATQSQDKQSPQLGDASHNPNQW